MPRACNALHFGNKRTGACFEILYHATKAIQRKDNTLSMLCCSH